MARSNRKPSVLTHPGCTPETTDKERNMLWNDPKKQPDGSIEPRIGQPQSGEEKAKWEQHFPDPKAPSTHAVVYRWEDSPNRNAPRRIVFECVPKTEAGKAPKPITPEPPTDQEDRRRELAAMDRPHLKTAYARANLGNLPDKTTPAQAIASILEAEGKTATSE